MATLQDDRPKPGIYPGVPFETYASWSAVNHSFLKWFEYSAEHALEYRLNPPPSTRDQIIGSATHALLLEPDQFAERYCPALDRPKRSKADKLAHIRHSELNSGKTELKPEEWDLVHRMAEAVRCGKNSTALELVEHPKAFREVVIVWNDPDTGLLCKARIDLLMKSFRGFPTAADFKTTRDRLTIQRRGKFIAEFKTYSQFAFYCDGLDALTRSYGHEPVHRRILAVLVEKKPPHGVAVTEIDEDDIEQGRRECRRWLNQAAECFDSGVWPGYSASIGVASLPMYAKDGGL